MSDTTNDAVPSEAFEDCASEEGINNFHFNHCWAAWQAAPAQPCSEDAALHRSAELNNSHECAEDAANGAMGEREGLAAAYKAYCGKSHAEDTEQHESMAFDFEAGWQARAALTAEKVAQAGPVAYVGWGGEGKPKTLVIRSDDLPVGRGLYAAPQPAQTQVALTDEQIYQAIVAANCAITKGYGTGAAADCIRALLAESGNATGEGQAK